MTLELESDAREAAQRSAASRVLFALTAIDVLAACVFGYRYVLLAGPLAGAKHVVFIHAAVLGQVALLFTLAGLALYAISRPRMGRRALPFAVPLVFGLLALFLVIDVGIYGHFKFHFNGLVLSILTSPVMRKAMDIPRGDVALVIGVGVALLAAQAVLFVVLRRTLAGAAWRPRWAALVAVVLALIAVEKSIYAVSDLRGERHLVRSVRAVPLYQRFTIRNVAQKLGIVPKKQAMVRIKAVDPEDRTLKYPRAPLVFEEPAEKLNVLWLNLEGWRWDMFSEENTPNIWAFAQGEQVFEYHVSGGNRTATGVFTQFYGLYGNYWDTFLSERRAPVLITRLNELGYRIDADASREVGFFDMRNATFVDMPEVYHYDWPTDHSRIRDQAIVDHVKAFVEQSGETPFFSWVLFDSSHVAYDFPPEFAKFEPYAEEVRYREIGISAQRAIEARNRYRNAVLYEDHLVGGMLDWLKESGRLEDTVVIITGDHGEEFYENGHWTHGGGCTPQVVRVPLVVHVPGKAPARYTHVTGHHDIVPTLMEMLGTKSPASDYALGRSLFGEERVPHVVACGWDQSALVDESGWLIFANDFQNPLDYEVRDPAYREVEDAGAEVVRRTPHVAGVMRSMNAFLK